MSRLRVLRIALLLLFAPPGAVSFRLKTSVSTVRSISTESKDISNASAGLAPRGTGPGKFLDFFSYIFTACSRQTQGQENTTLNRLILRLQECVGFSPWVGIKKTARSEDNLVRDLASQILDTMANPGLINQRATALCGPASFLHVMAIGNPNLFKEYVIQVFCYGPNDDFAFGHDNDERKQLGKSFQGGWLDEQMLTTSSNITEGQYHRDRKILRVVDYIALTAMRGTNNFMHQLTFPETMKKWVDDHLKVDAQVGSATTTRMVLGVLTAPLGTNRVSLTEIDALAKRVTESNGHKVAILLIGLSSAAAALPEHWLVFHGMASTTTCVVWETGGYALKKYEHFRSYTFMAIEINLGDHVSEVRLAQIRRAIQRQTKINS